MSLVGFKSQNHPQQTAAAGPRDDVDDRGTTSEMFIPLYRRFRFTLDVAASPTNTKCTRYFTREDDGLEQTWHGSVWCNPPYSNIGAWVEKAWHEWSDISTIGGRDRPDPRGSRPFRIVMLLPANRTEQGWWQDLVEPRLRERRDDFHVEFLRGRPRFIRPGAVIGPKGDRPPFGCCLLIWERP